MVNNNFLARLLRGSVSKLSLLILLGVIFSFGFTACKSNVDSVKVTPTLTTNKSDDKKVSVIQKFNNKTYQLPKDLFVKARLNSDQLLVLKDDSKVIYSYDLKNNTTQTFSKVKNPNNFVHSIVCNNEWLVWLEDESKILNTENKAFRWELIAQNLSTKEQVVIDKSTFTTNNFDVPGFINYSADKIAISDQNVVVYIKTSSENTKIASEIDMFDLKTKKRNVISKTSDVTKELIANCNIYKDHIVWSKYRELSDPNFQKRLTQYVYSDIFIYNVKTTKIEQLTENDFYDEPALYENNLVAVKVPEKQPNQGACESNVVLMNISDKKIKTIVDKNSLCYAQVADQSYRTLPVINAKYLSWYELSGDNRFIFDYQNNNFVEVYEKKDSNKVNYSTIHKMFNNFILLYDNKENAAESKSLCIDIGI